MKLLSETGIVLLDGPKVSIPAILDYFVVMKRPVTPVSKIPMDAGSWSLKPMMCGVSCVLKVILVDMGCLKCTLWTLVWWLVGGVVWTGEVVSCMRCLAWIDVVILCVLASYAIKP